ncbi:hypothetical protein AAVH_26347 [Aphelenchoides avenae]|nr:hypothetical protein AAVH_26347 [Aphelenchus avenae]
MEQKKIEALNANAVYERTREAFRKCADVKHGPWFDHATFLVSPRVPYSRDYYMYPHRNHLVTAVREYPCEPDGSKPAAVRHHEEYQSPYFPLHLGQFYDTSTHSFYESQKLYPVTLSTFRRLEIFSRPCKKFASLTKKNARIAAITNLQVGFNMVSRPFKSN